MTSCDGNTFWNTVCSASKNPKKILPPSTPKGLYLPKH